MSENTDNETDRTISENTPKTKRANKKTTPNKSDKTPTEKQVQSRGTVKQSELVKWTVFVRPEVKVAVQKAAKKAGITDTAWLDMKLWEASTSDLSKRPQPPAKIEDMADILKQFTDSLKASQEAAQNAQAAIIEKQGEQIAALTKAIENQPAPPPAPSLKELIFGRSNKS